MIIKLTINLQMVPLLVMSIHGNFDGKKAMICMIKNIFYRYKIPAIVVLQQFKLSIGQQQFIDIDY